MNNFETLEQNLDAVNSAVGAGFWDTVFSNPLLYLGYLFAFAAAIGFLIFLRGFLSGFPKVFSMDWHEEHQEHYRTRTTWGFFILLYLFIAWEMVTWAVGGVWSLFN